MCNSNRAKKIYYKFVALCNKLHSVCDTMYRCIQSRKLKKRSIQHKDIPLTMLIDILNITKLDFLNN